MRISIHRDKTHKAQTFSFLFFTDSDFIAVSSKRKKDKKRWDRVCFFRAQEDTNALGTRLNLIAC